MLPVVYALQKLLKFCHLWCDTDALAEFFFRNLESKRDAVGVDAVGFCSDLGVKKVNLVAGLLDFGTHVLWQAPFKDAGQTSAAKHLRGRPGVVDV